LRAYIAAPKIALLQKRRGSDKIIISSRGGKDATDKVKVTLTASSGVLLDFGGEGCAIDALHDEKQRSWSTVTPDMLPGIWTAFGPEGPELVLATHGHPDHFSSGLWAQAQERWQGAAFVSPAGGGRTVNPAGLSSFSVGGIRVETRPLPHEGAEYAGTPHYGYLVECGGFTVLHAGDCAVAAAELETWLAGRSPDLAVLDFPWLTLTRGRKFTEEVIRPKHLLLCHLPFAADDIDGYRAAAASAAGRESVIADVRCLTRPFQTEAF
jgi:L-ascorbate metabolism protein UlaG (beta-lactamase superfamily)